jgi:hypothetical protein
VDAGSRARDHRLDGDDYARVSDPLGLNKGPRIGVIYATHDQ